MRFYNRGEGGLIGSSNGRTPFARNLRLYRLPPQARYKVSRLAPPHVMAVGGLRLGSDKMPFTRPA